MPAILVVLLVLLAIAALLWFRYLQIRLGFKDSNYGGVQHIRQMPPKPDPQAISLPGSRMGEAQLVEDLRKEMKQELHIQTYGKNKYKRRLFVSKADIRRSFIIDSLLERPKF